MAERLAAVTGASSGIVYNLAKVFAENGYRPVVTYSAHEFADARLARAVDDYLRHERAAVARTIAHYENHAPFRRGDGGGAETLGETFDADL